MSEPLEQYGAQSVDKDVFELFALASELPAEERRAFLDSRCGGDSSVRTRVERLLAYHDQAGPLDDSLPRGLGLSRTKLLSQIQDGGVVGGRFRVVRTIGSGGMGTVYEAEDLDGGANVALKTIRVGEASDGELARRLRRELRLGRDVSHPNVCRVYDYWDVEDGEGDRITFFTMELLSGETLADRLRAKGKLPATEAIRILEQVAAGVDEIHRAGIVHRDLKPGNIFLVEGTPMRAVVMDFGIARAVNAGGPETKQTTTGVMVGTPRYMSPEQASGERVDQAADIYSFGVLALEMVSGETNPLVKPSSVVPKLRSSWDEALLQCFQSPAQRPKSAVDVVAAIKRRAVPWKPVALAAFAAAALALVFWQGSNAGASARYGTEGAKQLTFDDGFTGDPATTADGKVIVYASDRGSTDGDLNIWSEDVESRQTRKLTTDPGDEDEPAISPDGKLLAYRHGSNNTLYLKAIPDGQPREVGKWISGARFSPDGTMLAYWVGHSSTPGQIWLLPIATGDGAQKAPRRIADGFVDARFPTWSPDSQSILFRGSKTAIPSLEANREWWITDRDGTQYKATGAADRLAKSGVVPHDTLLGWDGKHVIFSAANLDSTNLWRLNLFSVFGMVLASPQVITSGSGYQGIPALLGNGRVAFADWRHEGHIWRIDPATAKMTKVTSGTSKDAAVSTSENGRRMVFVRIRGKSRDIWMREMKSGTEREVWTGEDAQPWISPEGGRIAVSMGRKIWLLDITSSKRELLSEDAGEVLGWSPDGTGLLYSEKRTDGKQALVRISIKDKSRLQLLEAHAVSQASYSADGKLLAAAVREDSSHSRIMIAPVLADGIGPWKAVTGADHWSERPIWSEDGSRFFYVTDRDQFWCLFGQRVDRGKMTAIGEPVAVEHLHTATHTLSHLVDASSGLARGGGYLYLCVGAERSNIWSVRP